MNAPVSGADGRVVKECSSCHIEKSLDCFARDSKTRDGLYCHCKICGNAAKAKWRKENRERHAAVNAAWNKANPERRAASKAKSPVKVKARNALRNAIRTGHVKRPDFCEGCLCACKPHGHHWSYAQEHWLDVTFLCEPCHKAEHARLDNLEIAA